MKLAPATRNCHLATIRRILNVCEEYVAGKQAWGTNDRARQDPFHSTTMRCFVLKELGGWETTEMVKNYAHLDAGHLNQDASVVTFWSQQNAEKQRATG